MDLKINPKKSFSRYSFFSFVAFLCPIFCFAICIHKDDLEDSTLFLKSKYNILNKSEGMILGNDAEKIETALHIVIQQIHINHDFRIEEINPDNRPYKVREYLKMIYNCYFEEIVDTLTKTNPIRFVDGKPPKPLNFPILKVPQAREIIAHTFRSAFKNTFIDIEEEQPYDFLRFHLLHEIDLKLANLEQVRNVKINKPEACLIQPPILNKSFSGVSGIVQSLQTKSSSLNDRTLSESPSLHLDQLLDHADNYARNKSEGHENQWQIYMGEGIDNKENIRCDEMVDFSSLKNNPRFKMLNMASDPNIENKHLFSPVLRINHKPIPLTEETMSYFKKSKMNSILLESKIKEGQEVGKNKKEKGKWVAYEYLYFNKSGDQESREINRSNDTIPFFLMKWVKSEDINPLEMSNAKNFMETLEMKKEELKDGTLSIERLVTEFWKDFYKLLPLLTQKDQNEAGKSAKSLGEMIARTIQSLNDHSKIPLVNYELAKLYQLLEVLGDKNNSKIKVKLKGNIEKDLSIADLKNFYIKLAETQGFGKTGDDLFRKFTVLDCPAFTQNTSYQESLTMYNAMCNFFKAIDLEHIAKDVMSALIKNLPHSIELDVAIAGLVPI